MNAGVNEFESASLEQEAQKVRENIDKSDEYLIEAAKRLHHIRERIEAGEVGDVKWLHWVEQKTGLSRSRIYELDRIGRASNPEMELETLRKEIREKVQKSRAEKAAREKSLEAARKTLIEFARTGPLPQVERLAKQAERLQRLASNNLGAIQAPRAA